MRDEVPPPLRPLAARPAARQSGPADRPPSLLLQDPLGLSGSAPDHIVELDARTWSIARAFDGTRTVDELAEQLAADGTREAALLAPEVHAVWKDLSRRRLLLDEAYENRLSRALSEFHALDIRPPVHAGDEYPSDPIDLRILVGGVVADDWDLPPVTAPHALLMPATGFDRLRGLYSRGYAALRHARDLRRVLLVGALEAPSARPLIPLTRDAATPMGLSTCDREGLAALSLLPGPEELLHRWNPVLERHLPFLQLLFPRVPVLCVLAGALPERDDGDGRGDLDEAAAALARVLALPGQTLLLMAGDLSRRSSPGEGHLDSEVAEAALARDADTIVELALQSSRHPTSAGTGGLAPLVLGLKALAQAGVEATGVRLGSERVLVAGESRVGLSVLYR